MDMHYCDIFGDCYHCPAAVCPYEKYEHNFREDDEKPEEEEDENLQD